VLYKIILNVIALVAIAIIIEYIYGNIFKLDTDDLIWVNYLNQGRVEAGAPTMGSGGWRMQSIFSYPHSASLLCAVGLFMALLQRNIKGNKNYKFYIFIYIAGLLLTSSRQAFLSVLLGLLYISVYKKNARKYFIIFFIVLGIIVFYSFYISQITWIYANTTVFRDHLQSAIQDEFSSLTLLPFPKENYFTNAVYFLFGTGLGFVPGSNPEAGYIIFNLELHLITSFLFEYGFVFLLSLAIIFFNIFRLQNNLYIIYYKVIFFQFAFSLLHYGLMYTVGVIELFFILYAIIITNVQNMMTKNEYQ